MAIMARMRLNLAGCVNTTEKSTHDLSRVCSARVLPGKKDAAVDFAGQSFVMLSLALALHERVGSPCELVASPSRHMGLDRIRGLYRRALSGAAARGVGT